MSQNKRSLPWTLWITLFSLFAAIVACAVAAYMTKPLFLIGIPVPVLLIWGLARGKRWAYLLTIVFSVFSLGFTIYYETQQTALYNFLIIIPILLPVLICTWFFFPKTGLASESYPEPPNPARTKQFIYCLIAVALLIAAMQTLTPTIKLREKYNLSVNPVSEGVPPEVVLATTALGGFRSIFIDVLWLRAIAMKAEGNYFEMVQLYDWITNLQPHYSQVWSFIAWDLAYNISVDYDQLEDRWFWIYRGIRMLRDKGIPANQENSNLYLELAWIYEHKLGATMDYAHQHYRAEWWNLMQQALKGSGERVELEVITVTPDELGGIQQYLNSLLELTDKPEDLLKFPEVKKVYDYLSEKGIDLFKEALDLIDFPEDYTEEVQKYLSEDKVVDVLEVIRDQRIKVWLLKNLPGDTAQQLIEIKKNLKRLKLEPELMLKVTKSFGPLDWRGFDAHSLYWVFKGREIRRRQLDEQRIEESLSYKMLDIRFERRLYAIMQELLRRGRIMITSEGYTYTVPDYRFNKPTLNYFKKVLQEIRESHSTSGKKLDDQGIRSCYIYLLERCVFMSYFNGQLKEAEKYLGYMREEYPLKKAYQYTAEQYVRNNISGFLESMSANRYHTLMDAKIRSSYVHLALGDYDSAANLQKEIDMLYEYAQKRWPYAPEIKEQQWKYIAPLEDMYADMLVPILDGQAPGFSPQMRKRLEAALGPKKVQNARLRVKQKADAITRRLQKEKHIGQQ